MCQQQEANGFGGTSCPLSSCALTPLGKRQQDKVSQWGAAPVSAQALSGQTEGRRHGCRRVPQGLGEWLQPPE